MRGLFSTIIRPAKRKLVLCVIALFSALTFFALDLPGYWVSTHNATLQPKNGTTDPIVVVFYGNRFKSYVDTGHLEVPKLGWIKAVQVDSTTLTSTQNALPLKIRVRQNEVIQIDLLKSQKSGIAELTSSGNTRELIDLKSIDETVFSLKIGGEESLFPLNDVVFSIANLLRALIFALGIFVLYWTIVENQIRERETITTRKGVSYIEIFTYFIIVFASSMVVVLSFWPANVPYDGSLHWIQAVTRGELNAPLGITATLFLRLFTYISHSPAIVIFAQSIFGAIGVALILYELRHRGVSHKIALLTVVILALTPQYPTFFTNLGKDAFCTVGLLFLVWSVLLFERVKHTSSYYIALLIIVSSSAIFASLMRPNALVAAVVLIVAVCLSLFTSQRRIAAVILCASFGLGVLFIPKLAVQYSDEQTAKKLIEDISDKVPGDGPGKARGKVTDARVVNESGLPFGLSGNFYIYHFYAAAVYADVKINAEDEKHFLAIADREVWKTYHCYMTDTTFIAISKNILIDQLTYHKLLRKHQWEMGMSVLKILWQYPKVFLARQACITKMLWSMEYGQKPFQATVTLGFDNVDPNFEKLVGKNESKLSDTSRNEIQSYVWWTEQREFFWIFWKPAGVLLIGLFCVVIRLVLVRDTGIFLAVLIPTTYIATLLIVIPFPAYRYAFPATLLMFLFATLAFAPIKSNQVN
jgi:Dolichyl-phosphate-mannose-protein mannosyltransferase